MKERICGRVADAFDPCPTRTVRRSARRSQTTYATNHIRLVKNYTFPAGFRFHQFVATQLLVSLILRGANVSPAGLQALRRQHSLRKGW
ncbi:MAG TPA: hypothetical protein VFS77_10600 [Pyrinomonadaceae bacterium]|nr:hypothetical protein [Pyrinomonadaceae bacterium]